MAHAEGHHVAHAAGHHVAHAAGHHVAHVEGQQHPISVYLWIWGLLFVLSAFSYKIGRAHV